MSEGTAAQVLARDANWCFLHGDSFSRLLELPPNSVDAIVADPPAGIGFMGRDWDKDKGGMREWIGWLACIMERSLRALKPGGHALVWALPRTSHWTGMALEYAGFEVRAQVQHWFGSGFPKSLNLDGEWDGWGTALKPANEVWWLVRKPLERGLTLTQNVAKWGTGALNIDACRVAHSGAADLAAHQKQVAEIKARGGSMENSWKNSSDLSGASDVNDAGRWPPDVVLTHDIGCKRVGTRAIAANPTWDTPNRATEPSAFTGSEVSKIRHANGRDGEASADKRYTEQGSTSFAPLPGARRDDTEEVDVFECVAGCPIAELARQSGQSLSSGGTGEASRVTGMFGITMPATGGYGDTGSAARFFPQFEWSELDDIFRYLAKPARSERDAGLAHFRPRSAAEVTDSEDGQARLASPRTGAGRTGGARNPHPTVKGQAFLRWACRLITPPRGVVLTPFGGCGSEGMAAVSESFRYIGIELSNTDDEPFVEIARARIHHVEGVEFVPRESLRAAEPPKQVALFGITSGKQAPDEGEEAAE